MKTPEERAKALKGPPTWFAQDDIAVVADAIQEAVAEERDACCRAICVGCREGELLGRNEAGGFMHQHTITGWAYGCAASAIRARTEAEKQVESKGTEIL
jgi:hypothetical protein